MSVNNKDYPVVERWVAYNGFSYNKPTLWKPRKFYFMPYGDDWKIIFDGKNLIYKRNMVYASKVECARDCIAYNNQELGSFSLTHAIVNQELASICEEEYVGHTAN